MTEKEAQTDKWEILFENQETRFNYFKDGWTLVEVVEESCKIPLLGNTQAQYGHSPGQPILGDKVWAGDVGVNDLQRALPTLAILWLCKILSFKNSDNLMSFLLFL